MARSARGRVVIVDVRGRLVADSESQDALGADYSTRPEIAAALEGGTFQEQRRSDTLDQEILATALPVLARGTPEGAVRVTQSVDAVNRATRASILGLIAIGGLVLLLGLAAGALIARQIAGPLRRLDIAAERVKDGDLSARAKVEGSEEQRSLATTFNQMTAGWSGWSRASASSSPTRRTSCARRSAACGCGSRRRAPMPRDPETEEEIDAALQEVDRLSAMVTELLLLSQAGEADAPAERVDLADAARRAAERFPDGVSTVSGAPVPPVRSRPPTSTARSTSWWRTPSTTAATR